MRELMGFLVFCGRVFMEVLLIEFSFLVLLRLFFNVFFGFFKVVMCFLFGVLLFVMSCVMFLLLLCVVGGLFILLGLLFFVVGDRFFELVIVLFVVLLYCVLLFLNRDVCVEGVGGFYCEVVIMSEFEGWELLIWLIVVYVVCLSY